MPAKYVLATACAVALNLTAAAAFAGANDYAFESLAAEIKKGDDVVVALRLTHKPSGKPVADAVIIRTRVDMAPDGMADMVSPVAHCRPPNLASTRSRLICRWRTVPGQRCRESAGRTGNGRRQGHRQSGQVSGPLAPATDDTRNAMTQRFTIFAVTLALSASAAGGYLYWNRSTIPAASAQIAAADSG